MNKELENLLDNYENVIYGQAFPITPSTHQLHLLLDYIANLGQQCKKQKEVIDKAVKYIENEMPYLQEIDKEYEDVNGNTYFTYKEYDGKELLDILKEVSE